MSGIIERLGISANRPLPREIVPLKLTADAGGAVTSVSVDDSTLMKIISSLQMDIFKVASNTFPRFTESLSAPSIDDYPNDNDWGFHVGGVIFYFVWNFQGTIRSVVMS